MAKSSFNNAAFKKAVQKRMAQRGVKPFPPGVRKKGAPSGLTRTRKAAPVQSMASGRIGPKPAAPRSVPAAPGGIAGAAQRKLQRRFAAPSGPIARKKMEQIKK